MKLDKMLLVFTANIEETPRISKCSKNCTCKIDKFQTRKQKQNKTCEAIK